MSNEAGTRFNAKALFSPKSDDEWMALFEKLIDLFFKNTKIIEEKELKDYPQYSYDKVSSIFKVLDITEEDFEIILPYILKTVKDINKKVYPDFLIGKKKK